MIGSLLPSLVACSAALANEVKYLQTISFFSNERRQSLSLILSSVNPSLEVLENISLLEKVSIIFTS